MSCAQRNSIHKFVCMFVTYLSLSLSFSLSQATRQPTFWVKAQSICSVVSHLSVSQSQAQRYSSYWPCYPWLIYFKCKFCVGEFRNGIYLFLLISSVTFLCIF